MQSETSRGLAEPAATLSVPREASAGLAGRSFPTDAELEASARKALPGNLGDGGYPRTGWERAGRWLLRGGWVGFLAYIGEAAGQQPAPCPLPPCARIPPIAKVARQSLASTRFEFSISGK